MIGRKRGDLMLKPMNPNRSHQTCCVGKERSLWHLNLKCSSCRNQIDPSPLLSFPENLGTQTVKGASGYGYAPTASFDVAKITRPLASASEIFRKDYKVVFDSQGSYIQNKRDGNVINFRQEGALYFLDLCFHVLEELSHSPFVRQVT